MADLSRRARWLAFGSALLAGWMQLLFDWAQPLFDLAAGSHIPHAPREERHNVVWEAWRNFDALAVPLVRHIRRR